MGGADEPPLLDRIHSWAKASAADRNPFARQDSNRSLPVYNKPARSNGTAAASRSTSTSGHFDGSREEKPEYVSTSPTSASNTQPTSPLGDDKEARNEPASLGKQEGKPPWSVRMKEGSKRFAKHTKDAICHSWINVLLVFVPVGIALNWVPMPGTTKPTVVFAINAVSIVPLAGLLAHATESVASRMGDTWASLLNVTFGNAVELIIFIIALTKNEIRIVQASILGSILANLLLILGMAFVLGGLRFREQIYNSTVTQMSACLLSLSVTSLLLPTAFHASFSNYTFADLQTTKISRGVSVVLLLVYALYLAFQLKSHAYMYESTPQNVIDEESHPGVLADLMNSSSDSSSSSSDSDSDSSGSSHTTAKKIRRVLRHPGRRRKSSENSFVTASPATTASPNDKRSASGDISSAAPPAASIIADIRRHGQEPQAAVFSGDEADTDGEHGIIHGTSRFRDFGDTGESSMSIHNIDDTEDPELSRKKKKLLRKEQKRAAKREKRERKRAKKNRAKLEATPCEQTPPPPPEIPTLETLEPSEAPRAVAFADEAAPLPTSTTAKRPFAMSRNSFRPALPKVLSNTVFSNPPPRPVNSTQPARLAVAYRGGRSQGGLRRTSSLPDRLREQGQPARTTAQSNEPAQRDGTLTINEADTIRKDKEDEGEAPVMSRTAAVVLLLVTTGLVAFCAELLVDAIPDMIANSNVSQAFIGLIILPIVGNAAEHVTAVTVATKNKMDLAIGVAVGSSIQIALFVTPFVVILGWIMNKEMSLYFNLFETVSLFVTAFVINFLILDGRSNYLEGSLLIAAYVIIAVCSFFYPDSTAQSEVGGGTGSSSDAMSRLRF